MDKHNEHQEDLHREIPMEPVHPTDSPYEATREVVRRHLSDINDEITDEDIKNAYTGKPVEEIHEDEKLIASRAKDIADSHSEDTELDKDHDGFDDDDHKEQIPPSNVIGE